MIDSYRAIEGNSASYFSLLGVLGFFLLTGAGAFLYIETQGHGVTNMTNQVVWGLPHVFAISLLVLASGALNLASMATVFGAKHYKQFRRFSAFLAIALLAGGLAVLVLDLGRPDRMLLTMMHMNFRSMFTWNVFLYSGFVVMCFLYLWTMMQHERFVKIAGSTSFVWRLMLPTGTGSIFGVIHARDVFHSAVTAPTFIAVSLSAGTALCLILLVATFRATGRSMDMKLVYGMRNALVFFTLLVGYLIVVEKFTTFYSPAMEQVGEYVLAGPHSLLYWGGVVGLGIVLPLLVLFLPASGNSMGGIIFASICSILGEMAFIAHVLFAGQAYPFDMFQGYEITSVFLDGQVAQYWPSLVELMLGLGGVAITGLIYVVGIKFYRLLPDKAVAPEGWEPWKP